MPSSKKKKSFGAIRKFFRRTILAIVILAAILLGILGVVINKLDPIIKNSVETFGPKYLGVPVTLGEVEFSVLRMRFELKDLVIGNPEGFHTENAIVIGRAFASVLPSTLFRGDVVRVQQILIENPSITYEVGLGDSNIGVILDHVKQMTDNAEKASLAEEEPAGAPDKGGKKVTIDEITVSGGQIHLSAKLLRGTTATIPLPTLTLRDIGKEENGTSILNASTELLTSLFTAIADTAKEGLNLLGDGLKDAGKAIGDGAGSAVDAIKNLFGK